MSIDRENTENIDYEKRILAAENRIAKAVSKLFDLDDILLQTCDLIKKQFKFDFVGISLVFLAQNTIDSVYGVGIASDWANRVRHYLEEDPDIRDIQVDIVKRMRTEIIAGWDDRFDKWIYETFNHNEIVRIFTPLLIARDRNGFVIRNWFENFDWEKNFTSYSHQDTNHNRTFDLNYQTQVASIRPIGTIEAGYQNKDIPIDRNMAIDLAKLSSKLSLEIRETRLRYILEIIAENTKEILQADSVTLHFLLNPAIDSYIYQVRSGNIDNSDPEMFSPRLNNQGLGWRAIQEGVVKFIDSSHPGSINPTASSKGTKAYAAFPLLITKNKQKTINQATETTNTFHEDNQVSDYVETSIGVIYVHYKNDHQFTVNEIRIGQVLTEKAVEAIWQAMTYQQVRDKVRHLKGHQSAIQSINKVPQDCDVLKNITWNVLNVLAADVVTIYPYNQTSNKFSTPPSIAGKLKADKEMETQIHEGEIPYLVLKKANRKHENGSMYTIDAPSCEIFQTSPFTKREKIKSVACILLKNDDEVVGIMFINYRRQHVFSEDDKQNINTLASSAATAIKSQRWIKTLSDIDKEIITTLEPHKLVELIIQRAVEITDADLGAILLRQDSFNLELIEQGVYAAVNHSVPENRYCTNSENKTFNKVLDDYKPELILDCSINQYSSNYFQGTISQMCVPLLGKDGGQDILIGILNVESFRRKFTLKDIQNLSILSDLAVIAIQNANNKQKLANIQMMTTLGDLATQLLHRMNGDMGSFLINFKDLEKFIREEDRESALKMYSVIQATAGRMKRNWKKIKGWKHEDSKLHDVKSIIEISIGNTQSRAEISLSNFLAKSSNVLEVFAEEQQLIGIFENIIQNSIDAMPDGGTISIYGTKTEYAMYNLIEIEIIDNGIGIEEVHLNKICELGFTTKDSQENLGLGLWWTAAQLESLGAKLEIKSIKGKGTECIVKFRIAKDILI
jgi:signal transduction histidine kinase